MKIFIGVIIGMLLITILVDIFPKNIMAVNNELVKEGMAHYNNDGVIIWNTECKEKGLLDE